MPQRFSGFLGERGVAALEFAFVFPLLIVFALGLVQFARAIQLQTTLDYAIQMAARCYAIDTGTCPTVATTCAYAATIATGLTASTLCANNFTVSAPGAGTGCGPTDASGKTEGVKVTASYVFDFLGSGLAPVGSESSGIPTSVTLGSTACFIAS